MNLLSGEGLTYTETPYGRVATVVSLPGFRAAWIYKDREQIDPSLDMKDVDDLIVMLQGGLKLELHGDQPQDIVLGPGEAFVIPAKVPFRGYRYPRDQAEPTVFLGIYPVEEGSA